MGPETILAIMLTMATPGKSIYSRTVVPEGSPRACENHASLLCAKPRPDPYWGGQWTRPETYAEGLARFWLIAQVFHDVAVASTWRPLEGCRRARVRRWGKGPSQATACGRAQLARPWGGTETELQRYLLTVALHESGMRRDTHAGKGAASRGDCKDPKDYRSCKSICLGQILKTSRRWRSPDGYTHESLGGLSKAATTRCVRTMVQYLSRARNTCTSPYGPESRGAYCYMAGYGGVRSSTDPRIRKRAATFYRTSRAPKLTAKVKAELGI